MKENKHIKTITNMFYLAVAVFALACFAVSPMTQAVTPAPDGGYPGNNTAEGDNALLSLTTGVDNTASGFEALEGNTTGSENTANGFQALLFNTTGSDNTANGDSALLSNINGLENTANGLQALFSNTTGNLNTASGVGALFHNTTGSNNTANGADALFHNTGTNNTATGFQALYRNTTGSTNIALGFSAGSTLTTGINNIDIGNVGVAAESNVIRIGTEGTQGAAYIAGISEEVVGANNLPVLIDSTGKLGTRVMSSRQFKKEIKPMNNASEAILALKPVTFRYKDDKTNTPQFGLIAEEVGKVDPDLVVRDKNGEIFTVRYEAVNAMLLNEFLREHQTVQELKKEVAALTAGLEKVSAQLEISKPATQTVLNNR